MTTKTISRDLKLPLPMSNLGITLQATEFTWGDTVRCRVSWANTGINAIRDFMVLYGSVQPDGTFNAWTYTTESAELAANSSGTIDLDFDLNILPATEIYGSHDALVVVGVLTSTDPINFNPLDDYEEVPGAITVNPPPAPIGMIESTEWMAAMSSHEDMLDIGT